MRIVIVFSDFSYRGGERFLANLCKGLLQQQQEVILVAGRVGRHPKPLPQEVTVIHPPKLFNRVLQNNILYILLFFPITMFLLWKAVTANTLILAVGEFTSLWPSVFIAKLKHLVCVWCLLDHNLPPNSVFSHKLINAVFNPIHKAIVRKVIAALAIDYSLEPVLRNYYALKKVRTIPSGFDSLPFQNPDPSYLLRHYRLWGKKVLLIAGAVHPSKGHEIAITTLAYLQKKDHSVILFIVGGGESAYISHLKSFARKLRVERQVIFAGVVKESELKNYYAVSDILLCCGSIVGFTVLEAAYLRKPSFYPQKGQPLGALLAKLHVGFPLHKIDARLFAKEIEQYFHQRNQLKEKIERDRTIVLSNFSLQKCSERTLSFFQQVMSDSDTLEIQ